MKNIKIAISLIFVLLLAACTDDTEPVYNPDIKPVSAAFLTPAMEKRYELDEDNKYDVLDIFKWSATDYGIPIGRQYTLEMDVPGNGFADAVRLTVTTETEMEVITNDFNNMVARVGLKPFEEGSVVLRLITNPFGGEEGIMPLPDFPTVVSDSVKIDILPYEPDDMAPENMYMVGVDFGNWDFDSDGIVEMIPVTEREGEFWCINYFTAGNGFKWSPARGWGNDFAKLDTNTGFTVSGTDAFVDMDGLYMVYINYMSGIVAMEPAQVSGRGDCFESWDEGTPFAVSGQEITGTVLNDGRVRMYAESAFSPSDWWTREFIVVDGNIVYRANDGELAANGLLMPANAGQTITLDFRAGTGSIQ